MNTTYNTLKKVPVVILFLISSITVSGQKIIDPIILCPVVGYSPSTLNFTSQQTGSQVINVTTEDFCDRWTYTKSVSWITLTKSGNQLFVSVSANTGAARSGSIVLGNYMGNTITVNQAAAVTTTAFAGATINTCQSSSPSPITLSGASVGGSATTGAWSIISGGGSLSNTGYTSNPSSVTYTPASNFSGTVVLRLTSNYPVGGVAATSDRNIVVNAAPVASITANRTEVTCAQPSATLTASGGGTYLWSTGATTAAITVSPTSTTNYTVTVTSANGCTSSAARTITVNKTAPVASITANRTEITCTYPEATLTASGGGTYLWSTGATTAAITVTNGSITPYTVTVTAANGCTATASQVIARNNIQHVVTITADRTEVTCTNPTSAMTVNSIQGATYRWYAQTINGNELIGTSPSLSVSPTATTTYTVNEVGSNGCTSTASKTITADKIAPVASITANRTEVTCAQPSATLTASGGGTYQWSTGATTAAITVSPTSTTTYTVTVTSANGCTSSATKTITVNKTAPVASITANHTEITCTYPEATLTASGGGTYLWSTGATTAAITVTTGSITPYTVTVTAANGCTATASQIIISNKRPHLVSITANRTEVTCSNPTATLTANLASGSTCRWSITTVDGEEIIGHTPSITVSPTVDMIYTVTEEGSNGCSSSASQLITANKTAPVASITTNRTVVTCAQPSATLTASGGGTYLWNTGATTAAITVSPNTTTTYSVTVTSANGCSSTASKTITTDKTAPVASITANRTVVTCAQPSATLTASGGGTYLWNTGATTAAITVSPSTTTTYSVTVTSANGCSSTASKTITTDMTAPVASITANWTVVTCAQPSATLTASGGGTYLWNTGATTAAITVSPTSTTTYSVTVTSANGCSSTASMTITTDKTPPVANITASQTVVTCAQPSATLTASGGGTYLWNTGATTAAITVSPNTTTTYSVTVTSTNGCSSTASKTITADKTPPVANITANQTVVTCAQPSTTLTASGGGTYLWNTGATTAAITVSPNTTTTYSVTVTGANGCSSVASKTITVDKTAPVASITANRTEITCTYTNATLTASGGGTYLWSTGATTAAITVTNGSITPYTVTVTAANGCTATASQTITRNNFPHLVSITTDLNEVSCANPTATMTVNAIQGSTYQWYVQTLDENVLIGTSPSISVSPEEITTYTVTEVGSNGCTSSDTISILTNKAKPSVSIAANFEEVNYANPSATLTANGGVSYLWSTDETTSIINVSPLSTTTYTVTATGLNGCLNTAIKTILAGHYKAPTPSSQQNYIMVSAMQVPLNSADLSNTSLLNGLKCGDITHNIQYFDGLGRPLQTIAVAASSNKGDIVTPIGYDALGREHRKYLPYEDKSASGAYRPNNLNELGYKYSDQFKFYRITDGNTNTDIPDTNYPFAETKFEASPLSRVIQQGAPGEMWQPKDTNIMGSGHTINMAYGTNTAGEVIRWKVNSSGSLLWDSTYAAGSLLLTQTTDENGVASREYKDLQGQVVLKMAAVSTPEETSTYYVYDDLGRLRYVLPPMFVDSMGTNVSFNASSDMVKKFCYYYAYDGRGRMTVKQLPGAEPVYMVYDQRDRLVATQDGNMRDPDRDSTTKDGRWLITKYDALNRPVASAEFSFTKTRDSLQRYANTFTENNLYETRDNMKAHGYTERSFPGAVGDNSYLTVTYYDDYGYKNQPMIPFDSTRKIDPYRTTETVKYNERVKGLTTGTKVKVLVDGANQWLLSATYYDDHYRAIQAVRQTYPSGLEVTSSRYNFNGTVAETRTYQSYGNVTLTNLYAYDHAARPTRTTQTIAKTGATTLGPIVTAEQAYNALGQLKTKKLDGGAQQLDYAYNIRGWLTGINDVASAPTNLKQFALALRYTEALPGMPTTPQYNGNINSASWRIPANGSFASGNQQHYAFTYDNLSRLRDAQYRQGNPDSLAENDKYNETIGGYDLNGNIMAITRRKNGTLEDSLTFKYTGNKLSYVNDAANDNSLFVEKSQLTTAEYCYDGNGNMTKDLNLRTGLKYNLLNLPKEVYNLDTIGNRIQYVYDASGAKLAQLASQASGTPSVVTTETTYYSGVFVYDATEGLEYALTGEGRAVYSGSNFAMEYHLKDHLGNTRVTTHSGGGLKSSSFYYPFGLALAQQGGDNKYLYNGKELQDVKLGGVQLGWYDYGARFYDPTIGRWHSIDQSAEDYLAYGPYVYVGNNPVRRIDPDGNDGWDVVLGFGAALIDNASGGLIDARSYATKYVSDAKDFNRGQDAGDVACIGIATAQIDGGMMMVAGGEATMAGSLVVELESGGTSTITLAGGAAATLSGTINIAHGTMMMAKATNNLKEQKGRLPEDGKTDNTYNRVKPRKGTLDKVKENQPRNENGQMLDPNTGEVLDPKNMDLGHKTGQEWRTRKRIHKENGSTRQQVIEAENDPNIYQYEDRTSNRSHRYEKK